MKEWGLYITKHAKLSPEKGFRITLIKIQIQVINKLKTNRGPSQ